MARKLQGTDKHSPGRALLARLLLTLALVSVAIAGWIRYRFGNVSFDAIMTNVPGVGGKGAGNADLIPEAVVVCLVIPTLIVVVGSVVLQLIRRNQPRHQIRRPRMVVPVGAFAASLVVLLTVAGVPQQATALLSRESFAPYYTDPVITSVPDKPRNLVTIYLESMENSFSDEDVFGENLLADLDEVTQDWARYDGLREYPEGGWTMAGLVGTQCGIPLKSPLMGLGADPNHVGERAAQYLPGAVCLGDVLAENGYTNTWMGGADTEFAGKETYLRDHGYSEVKGLRTWTEQGLDPDNTSPWGLSDHALFEKARDTIDELAAKDEPFHLSLLTLDTHEPAGLFPGCDPGDPIAMSSAIKCSMAEVKGFVEYLMENHADDTVIVIMGDHLKGTSGASDFKTEMNQFEDRTIVLRVWSPDKVRFAREFSDQFSMAATTLELLDFGLEGGRAGLGVSLIGDHDLTDTAPGLPADEYEAAVTARSADLYRHFWNGSHS